MDFALDTRYTAPADQGASWYAIVLAEVRRMRVGDVPIRIEILGGLAEDGLLDGVSDTPHGVAGAIQLEGGTSIPGEDIAGFILLSDPPEDRSNEIHG